MSKALEDLMVIITACACLDIEFISSNECVKKFENIKNALKDYETDKKRLDEYVNYYGDLVNTHEKLTNKYEKKSKVLEIPNVKPLKS